LNPHHVFTQQGEPPWDAEPRFELGPALQQADALPTELRRISFNMFIFISKNILYEQLTFLLSGLLGLPGIHLNFQGDLGGDPRNDGSNQVHIHLI